MSDKKVHAFQAEVSQVLSLVINSLYRHREVFLRELISNASDALDRLRFRAIREPELLEAGETLRVRIIPDPDHGTLTIQDNGVGMTAEELEKNLGTVAWSGSREFLEQLQQAQAAEQEGLQLIGQFGVGFYSAYLVADRVQVVSRAAGSEQAHRWESDAKSSFTIELTDPHPRGTSVVLHLKSEHREFLDTHQLRQLVARYSDYLEHPIELATKAADPEAPAKGELKYQVVNAASALWQRPADQVSAEQYEEFYKHLTHDWEGPLGWRHFRIEGTQMFTGLLFLPRQRPFDLFDPRPRYGVRLHVQRVFVMDEAEELIPRWLRFMRGVVDSEDLPLNVSREVLQDSRPARTIKKQVIAQSLTMLEEVARERPEDYRAFWKTFGAVLKEGVHFDPEYKDRVAELLRYESSSAEQLTSLAEYVDRMPDGQPAIYYAAGTARGVLEASPHLEALRRRGYEVLFMTDPIDPFAVEAIGNYRDRPLVSAMRADLKLDAQDGEPTDEPADAAGGALPLLGRFREVLSERVQDVKTSGRLTDSPACLVIPEGGLQPHVERMLRAHQLDVPVTKRILEVNESHPLIQSLNKIHTEDPKSERLVEWIELVYSQALLAEGSPIDDPARLARQVSDLVTAVATQAASKS
jgi:molecular chaperone HtpG